jgi:hypothetical protein
MICFLKGLELGRHRLLVLRDEGAFYYLHREVLVIIVIVFVWDHTLHNLTRNARAKRLQQHVLVDTFHAE